MYSVGLQVGNRICRRVQNAAFLPKIRVPFPSYEKCRREKASRELRREVLEKNWHKCYCCDMKDREKGKHLELHHVVPVSFGGKTEANNLLPVCFNCHKSVHKLIDGLHLNPAKFRRSALEDAVLRIAELRARERARQFGRMEPQKEGIVKEGAEQQLSPEQMHKMGVMLFVLSLALSKKQYRVLRKELMRRPWEEKAGEAA